MSTFFLCIFSPSALFVENDSSLRVAALLLRGTGRVRAAPVETQSVGRGAVRHGGLGPVWCRECGVKNSTIEPHRTCSQS
ncbi:hypothetical protein H4582DRAFT_1111743 [Lactarius indigo]|nr:hypothetical protein H4582DRAFT_1111743 [Lactarius indigo]